MRSWEPVVYNPIGGINLEDNDAALGENEVRTAQNLLFEAGECKARPGTTTTEVTTLGSAPVFFQSLYVGGTPWTVMQLANGKIYKVVGTTATEITGAGTTFGSADFNNVCSVNGAVLFGNNTGGVLRWLTTGVVYTILASARMRYLTSHLSRAVGAYDTNVAGTGQIMVEWSKPGDETVWNTSPSTDGSGSTTLSDAPDDITGLKTIRNTIVVVRRTGFHLGFPTGVAIPAFRFEVFRRGDNSVGCPYPATVAVSDETLFFVGPDDIYMFDLNEIVPIGYKVRTAVLNTLRTANKGYAGFISRMALNGSYRTRYNLVPYGSAVSATDPHFCYDLRDRTWSRHVYNTTSAWGFNFIQSGTAEGLARVNASLAAEPIDVFTWDANVACESLMRFTGRTMRIGPYDRDMQVNRVMMNVRDKTGVSVTVTVDGRRGDTAVNYPVAITAGTNNDSHWVRKWGNCQGPVGQDVQVSVSVNPNLPFSTDTIMLEVSEAGQLV